MNREEMKQASHRQIDRQKEKELLETREYDGDDGGWFERLDSTRPNTTIRPGTLESKQPEIE